MGQVRKQNHMYKQVKPTKESEAIELSLDACPLLAQYCVMARLNGRGCLPSLTTRKS
jgi:hypothetical protein